jgi:hypothetical protein
MLAAAFTGAARLTRASAIKAGRCFTMALSAAALAPLRPSSIGNRACGLVCSLQVSNAQQQIRSGICGVSGICIGTVRRGAAGAVAHASPVIAHCSPPGSSLSVAVTIVVWEMAAAAPQRARIRAPRPLVVTGGSAIAAVTVVTLVSAASARPLPILTASLITTMTLISATRTRAPASLITIMTLRMTRVLPAAVWKAFSARPVAILGLNSSSKATVFVSAISGAPKCTVPAASASAPAVTVVPAAGGHPIVCPLPACIRSARALCAAVARGVAPLQLRPKQRLCRGPRRAPAHHGSGLARDGFS